MGTIFGIIGFLCAIYVIYDVLVERKDLGAVNKLVWIVFALLFNILTAIVYYLTQKR